MQWLIMIMCLYAGVASARTEEDQQASSTNVVAYWLKQQCFYRPQIDCPDDSDKCPCKRITHYDGNAALCCNIDKRILDDDFSCIGEHCTL